MRILIIGSGGREHALAWFLGQSDEPVQLFIAPGNAGTASLGQNIDIDVSDIDALLAFAREDDIDLTVVGPEKPLVLGIVDRFERHGLPIVGPSAAAARLEGSKAFAKTFMHRHGIPTSAHRTFEAEDLDKATAYVRAQGAPIVVKASGLAAGKGAVVCMTVAEAHEALEMIVRGREFGSAGDRVVVESFLEGEEASVFALTDGHDYVVLAPAQDHKQIGEGDTGPNTGGMGAYAPAPLITDALLDRVRKEVIGPTLNGMRDEGHPYRGVLYVGLMITSEGPKVVEFNCRLGDPEAQVLLPLIGNDPVHLFSALARRRLGSLNVEHRSGAAACVVLASGGYPGAYEKGVRIDGLDEAGAMEDVMIFHAGTRLDKENHVVTDGGRVLGATALGRDLEAAITRAYAAVDRIQFEGMQYREDIGRKGLVRG